MSTKGKRIKELREVGLRLNQKQLAEKLEMSSQAISKVECDGGSLSLDKYCELAEIFSADLNWLLLGKGSMFIKNQEKLSFKYRLLEVQAESGLDDRDFAKKIGVSISELERLGIGKSEPTLEILQNIKKYFNKSTDYMLYGE